MRTPPKVVRAKKPWPSPQRGPNCEVSMSERKKTAEPGQSKPVNLGQHVTRCSICHHPEREAIERDFLDWKSQKTIAKEHKLRDRTAIWRHARALGLYPKRARNLKAALERIIERADSVQVTAAAVVAAIQAYAKINAAGQWVERTETVNLNQLFERMTERELEEYAATGRLPAWFEQTVGQRSVEGLSATPDESSEGDGDG